MTSSRQRSESPGDLYPALLCREARSQWLKEREGGLGGRVEAAVAAAQQLWRAQQRDELERQRAGLQRAHSTELEQQRAGLERAHSTELERQRAGLEKEQRRAVQLAVKAAQEVERLT